MNWRYRKNPDVIPGMPEPSGALSLSKDSQGWRGRFTSLCLDSANPWRNDEAVFQHRDSPICIQPYETLY